MKDNFISAMVAYSDMKGYVEFKELLKNNFDNLYKLGESEVYRQYMTFLNSPLHIREDNGVLEVNYMNTVIEVVSPEYSKTGKMVIEEINQIQDEEDFYIEMEDELIEENREDEIDSIFEDYFSENFSNLTADKLYFITSNDLLKITSPDLTHQKGPQIMAFQNQNTSELTITFRGTTIKEDWKQNGKMWVGIKEPKYFAKAREFVDELLFDENGDIKDEYKNLKLNVTGHSLGGSMAQYINQYIDDKLNERREHHEKNKDTEIAVKYKNIENEACTFNAANIARLMEMKNISKRRDNANNYRLTADDGTAELLSSIGDREIIEAPFEDLDLISFQSSFNMYEAHFGDEIYNSILIYDFLNSKYKTKGVDKVNELITEYGIQDLLKLLIFISKYKVNSIEELESLSEEEKNEIAGVDRNFNLQDVSALLFEHYIEDKKPTMKRKMINSTVNYISKVTPSILKHIIPSLTSVTKLQTNFKNRQRESTLNT
jgi:hypothetical protein